MSDRGASDFRERARVEADRYGPDPWIFVRELLQNARDAGASAVQIQVEEGKSGAGGRTRITCRDDGEGMSYDHARRYLFSLYASSKEERSNQVGRFGVGFWSILRFEPESIIIRSRSREGGAAWQVTLDGALQDAVRADVEMGPGTEVVLERAGGDGDDHRRVFEAAHQNARFLCQRDAPEQPLPITINGRRVNAPFALSAPCSSFHRGHVRGVVGLGNAPRVELFSRGLRVRSAACLDDLLSNTGHTAHSRVRFPELPGGLAPQALLESDGLELLLSRSDARDTRTLRRLVKLGQNELRHLVERQLAQIRPPGLGERIAGGLRRLAGDALWWRAVLGALGGAVLALLISHWLWPGPSTGAGGDSGVPGIAVGAADVPSTRTSYGDLSKRYHGPQVNELAPSAAEPIALHYDPFLARPYFAALIIEEIGHEDLPETPLSEEPYPDYRCEGECVAVQLPVVGAADEQLRIPVPSGHLLEPSSLRYVGFNQTRLPKV
ncbi:MAG: ATP-binding protein, partial [Myxococcales bacterium]|nr:ATP-binding protein [Myxococcales bacterium]